MKFVQKFCVAALRKSKSRYNLLQLKAGDFKRIAEYKETDSRFIKQNKRIEKLENALKQVDPNKLCIINGSHSTKTFGHKSDYKTAGQIVDETLIEDWRLAK